MDVCGNTTDDQTGALIAWPGWKHLGEAFTWGLVFAAWFGVIYGTADYLTAVTTDRFHVHFDAELAVPLVSAMVVFICRSIRCSGCARL